MLTKNIRRFQISMYKPTLAQMEIATHNLRNNINSFDQLKFLFFLQNFRQICFTAFSDNVDIVFSGVGVVEMEDVGLVGDGF